MDEEMELDVKPPPPPPQVACAGDQQLQLKLTELQHAFAHVDAHMAQTCGVYGEIIAAIDATAAGVRELRRRRRAEGHGAELAEAVRKVELVYGQLSAAVRLVVATRGRVVENMCRNRNRMLGGGYGGAAEAADALADALQCIHIGLTQ